MSRASLAVLVPSRARPHNAQRLIQACHATTSVADVILGVDQDDPELAAYQQVVADTLAISRLEVLPTPAQPGVVAGLNILAHRYAQLYEMVAFLGDDHLPRTAGWDVTLCQAVRDQGGGLAYGDDLLQRNKLPTAMVMEARIPLALGYLAPPMLWHLYTDNAWLLWGQILGMLSFHPDVVIEHLHPGAGTGLPDAGYARTGSAAYDQHDQRAFEQYCHDTLASDMAKIRRS
jgi:hypothetical protein